MDRRQKKTRESIFKAFINLLSKKHYNQITVGEIIEQANVGRATFYSHFETKDYLLKDLCEELFCHIFECANDGELRHKYIFDCNAPDSVILHLFLHLQKNDNNILKLLSCQNNELFLGYFKQNLTKLIKNQLHLFEYKKNADIPEDFWINHVCDTFISTVRWWIENDTNITPETLTNYFMAIV